MKQSQNISIKEALTLLKFPPLDQWLVLLQEVSNLRLFRVFAQVDIKAGSHNYSIWRTTCSRASIVFIRANPTKIQIYRQLLLALQIPRYLGCQHQIPNTAKYYMVTSLEFWTCVSSFVTHLRWLATDFAQICTQVDVKFFTVWPPNASNNNNN